MNDSNGFENYNNIVNCRFEYKCSLRWQDLKPTDDLKVRFCEKCQHEVFKVSSEEDLRRCAGKGDCVFYDFFGARASRYTMGSKMLWPTGTLYTISLTPSFVLTDEQLLELKDLLHLEESLSTIRAMFCNGEEHALLEKSHLNIFNIFRNRLSRVGVPFRHEEVKVELYDDL